MATDAEIVFGSLPLLSSSQPQHDYQFEVCADGTDYGNPEAVIAEVASMLTDGNRVQITRFGNHVMPLRVKISGTSLNAVSAGQAVLQGEVNRGRNTLSWRPPGWATASIFDVVISELKFEFDDLSETRAQRYFTLTLTCVPFARSDTLTTVIAEPVPVGDPTVTSIDPCTSATGWSASASTPSVSAGAIVAMGGGIGALYFTVTRAGLSTPVDADESVRIDVESARAEVISFETPDGINLPVRAIEWTAVGRRYYYLQVPTTFTGASIRFLSLSGATPAEVKVHDVSKVDRLPSSGPNQRSFTAMIGGSARTTADLILESDDGLGDEVMVYTAPWGEAIDPPLRRWFNEAGTVDAAAISGFANSSIDDLPAAVIPVSAIPPGTHLVVAGLRLASGGPSDIAVELHASLTDSPWADPSTDVLETATVPLTTSYARHAIGVVELPTAAVDATSDATVTLGIDFPDDDFVWVDDIWLYNLDAGVLTWLTGLTVADETPSKVEIRSATIDRDNPAWIVGTSGTDTDNVDASARATSPGVHQFKPGLIGIFAMTPDATEVTISAEFYKRNQHHMPPQDS